jgi:transposase-like protein
MAGKRRLWRYPDEFRQAAIGRWMSGELQKDVARDLGFNKQLMWRWRKKLAQQEAQKQPASSDVPRDSRETMLGIASAETRETMLRAEIQQLKGILAEKEVALSFFKGALQRIGARCQQPAGETASTSKSKR